MSHWSATDNLKNDYATVREQFPDAQQAAFNSLIGKDTEP